MAGLLNSNNMAAMLWPGLKAKFEEQYKNVPTYTCKFFYAYRTSPLFGIFKIRS